MKNFIFKLMSLIMIVMLVAMPVVFAEVQEDAPGYRDEQGSTNTSSDAADQIKEKGNVILSAVLWVGYTISLGMIIFIGIKYILGAAEARATMKTHLINWVIGAFLVFMCTTVTGWIINTMGAQNVENLASTIINAGNKK